MKKQLYLLERLEFRILSEYCNYFINEDNKYIFAKSDPDYFFNFISNTLMFEFKEWIYIDTIKENKKDAIAYLTLSIDQFKTYQPLKRIALLKHLCAKQIKEKIFFIDPAFFTANDSQIHSIFNIFDRFFNIYKTETEKALYVFSSGLLSDNNSHNAIDSSFLFKDNISYRDFNKFIKDIKEMTPDDFTVIHFNFRMIENVTFLKNEILKNITFLNKNESLNYVNHLILLLNNSQDTDWAQYGIINNWLEKYKVTEDELFSHKCYKNILYKLLSNIDKDFEGKINFSKIPDKYKIQKQFFYYLSDKFFKSILNFIFEQKSIILEITDSDLNAKKIKTNLSVPQLVCLFKSLYDNNIIDVPVKTHLYRFISDNFESKETDTISTNKIKNLFENPNSKDYEFWDEKFYFLKQYAYSKKGS